MRNFRKAALAGATAVAVAFGSTAVATAENKAGEATPTYTAPVRKIDPAVDSNPSNQDKSSTKVGGSIGAYKDGELKGADGRELFGKEKDNWKGQPGWAKAGYILTIFTAVSAAVGLIVGPLYNFIVHGPVNF